MALPVVSSVHIFYQGESAFDLRKAVAWAPLHNPVGDATQVSVTFQGMDPSARIPFPAQAFIDAKAASLAAGG
jgi:hypothetical protein